MTTIRLSGCAHGLPVLAAVAALFAHSTGAAQPATPAAQPATPAARPATRAAQPAARAAEREWTFELATGFRYADNLNRTAANEEEYGVATAGARLQGSRPRGRLRFDVDADLSYFHYLDDEADSEVLGQFDGQLRYALLPERLEWVVEEQFGQVLADLFRPVSVSNRQNLNIVRTGPDARLRLGARTDLRFTGRYALESYEASPLDAERLRGGLQLVRTVAAGGEAGIGARAESVEVDDATPALEYDLVEEFASYGIRTRRTAIDVELGRTEVDGDTVQDDEILARIEAARRVSPSATVFVRARREFVTAAEGAFGAARIPAAGADVGTAFLTADPVLSREAAAGVRWQAARTAVSIEARTGTQELVAVSQSERDLRGLRLEAVRRISPFSALSLFASHVETTVDAQAYEGTDSAVRMEIRRRFGRTISMALEYAYEKRNASGSFERFDENAVWLRIAYSHGEIARVRPVDELDDPLRQ